MIAALASELWGEAGLAPPHGARLMQAWLAGRPLDRGLSPAHQPFPASLLGRLEELAGRAHALARLAERHDSADGSARLLVELADGRTVESVLLPRDGLCISTQVGCAVGCRFCKTGESGLARQLSSDEILAQVALAARLRREAAQGPTRRVVLMGMGEPAHNLPAVLRAIEILGTQGRLGHKQIVFSTVGDPRAFEALGRSSVKPALAFSLHTLDDALRAELLPRAPRVPEGGVRALLDQALAYARASGHPLQIQWTLLEGLNDGERDVEALTEALEGARAIVNVIPWNALEGFGFQRPPVLAAVEFVRALKRRGVFATIRRSSGSDVEGACGQLRARSPEAAARGRAPGENPRRPVGPAEAGGS